MIDLCLLLLFLGIVRMLRGLPRWTCERFTMLDLVPSFLLGVNLDTLLTFGSQGCNDIWLNSLGLLVFISHHLVWIQIVTNHIYYLHAFFWLILFLEIHYHILHDQHDSIFPLLRSNLNSPMLGMCEECDPSMLPSLRVATRLHSILIVIKSCFLSFSNHCYYILARFYVVLHM